MLFARADYKDELAYRVRLSSFLDVVCRYDDGFVAIFGNLDQVVPDTAIRNDASLNTKTQWQ